MGEESGGKSQSRTIEAEPDNGCPRDGSSLVKLPPYEMTAEPRSASLRGKPKRYVDIDIIRGFSLITISLDHFSWMTKLLGRHSGSIPTLGSGALLPSTLAEVFFVLSGFLFGHVKVAGGGPIVTYAIKRAGVLYACNLICYFGCMIMLLFAARNVLPLANWDVSAGGILSFAIMRRAPFTFDILQIYVVSLLLCPIFVHLSRNRPTLSVVVLASTWGLMQLSSVSYLHQEWILSWLPWFLLFFAGCIVGQVGIADDITGFARRNINYISIVVIGLLVAISTANVLQYHLLSKSAQSPLQRFFNEQREHFGALRLVSFLCTLYLLLTGSFYFRKRMPRLCNALLRVGKRSLIGFCISNILLYASLTAWVARESDWSYYLYSALYAFVLLLFVPAWGRLVEGRKFLSQRQAAVTWLRSLQPR